MEEKPKILENLWSSWCNLNSDTREQVASQLGPFGRVLNIAANVQHLVQNPNSQNSTKSNDSSEVMFDDDDDVIEAEFEEVE